MINSVITLFQRGGPVMIPILIVSFIAWGIIFFTILDLRVQKKNLLLLFHSGDAGIKSLSAEHHHSAENPQIAPFIEMMRYIQSVKNVFSSSKLEDAITTCIELERKRLSSRLPALAAIAVVAPLLGLLGTITGMINTFNAISGYGTGDPALLGSGIAEALITTEAGLVVAIPVLVMHTYLASKIDGIISLMRHFVSQFASSGCAKENQ